MESLSKDIINSTPNVSRRPKFKKKKTNGAALKKEDYYIYRYNLFGVAAVFYKVAKGVGAKIFEYLLWKEKFNGREFITLPNDFFLRTWGIRRQRINDACKLLEAQDLIVVKRQPGFNNYVKLNVEIKHD
jgi:hypothetical protein|tara:strand:- start:1385 stop:1774 length:390 start_codon:yes stop_codon:yes gene_type:complete